MEKEKLLKIIGGIKPLPFLSKEEKAAFQLALDLVIASIE
tara:strand:- start:237 stop:356 length:120 start_codon:yes stop_codon:yes gene_type:complete